MMKRFSFILLACVASLMSLVAILREAIAGCSWEAIVLSDLHISVGNPERLSRVNHIVSYINAMKYGPVNFVVITGDAVATIENDSGTQNNIYNLVTQLNQLGPIPYYIALGNHDYRWTSSDDSDGIKSLEWIQDREDLWWLWSNHIVPAYKSFDYNGCWKFITLNSYRGNYETDLASYNGYATKHFDNEQLKWLSSQLASASANSEMVTIFMHHPLKTDHFNLVWGSNPITPSTDPAFYSLLKDRINIVKHIFVGHGHHFLTDTLTLLGRKINVRETASLEEPPIGCTYPKYIAQADLNTNNIKQNCN